ncbi:MAG: M50 family metallopeptidase [Cyanobacteria bacterium P01_G01_bin.54]
MSTPSTNPITKNLQYQWVLLHILSYSISVGVLTFALTTNFETLKLWLTPGFGLYLFMGIFWFQWLLLRRVGGDIRGWRNSGLLAVIASLPTVYIHPGVPFFTYSIFLSLRQYWTLKSRTKRAYLWLIVNPIGWFISLFVSGIISIIIDETTSSPVMVGVIAGLVFGVCRGFSSIYILRFLFQKPKPIILKDTTEQSKVSASTSKKTAQHQLFILIQVILVIIIFGIWSMYVPRYPQTWIVDVLFFTTLLPHLYFFILVHELGHLSVALACGFQLRFIAMNRLALVRNSQGLRFKFLKQYGIAGGLTSTFPRNEKHLTRKLILMVAGGPLASFMLFFLGILLLNFPNLLSQNPLLWIFTLFTASNLMIAVSNLIPFNFGGLRTDGGIIWILLRKTPDGLSFKSLCAYNAQLIQGIRPRAVKAETIEQALGASDRSVYQVGGFMIAYEAALDAGQLEQAGDYLDQALAQKALLPPFHRTQLVLEGAYFYAYVCHNLDVAQDWFAAAQDFSLVEPYTLARVKAALALVEDNYPQALEQAQQGIKQAQDVDFIRGGAIAELELLQQLEADAQQGLAAAV